MSYPGLGVVTYHRLKSVACSRMSDHIYPNRTNSGEAVWLGDTSLPVEQHYLRDGPIETMRSDSSNITSCIMVGVENDAIGPIIPCSRSSAFRESPVVDLTSILRGNRDHSLTESLCLILQNSLKLKNGPQTKLPVLPFSSILLLNAFKPLNRNNIGLSLKDFIHAGVSKLGADASDFPLVTPKSLKRSLSRTGSFRFEFPFIKGKPSGNSVVGFPREGFALRRKDGSIHPKIDANTGTLRTDGGRCVTGDRKPKLALTLEDQGVSEAGFGCVSSSGIPQDFSGNPASQTRQKDSFPTNLENPSVELERKLLFDWGFLKFLFIGLYSSKGSKNSLLGFNYHLARKLLKLPTTLFVTKVVDVFKFAFGLLKEKLGTFVPGVFGKSEGLKKPGLLGFLKFQFNQIASHLPKTITSAETKREKQNMPNTQFLPQMNLGVSLGFFL